MNIRFLKRRIQMECSQIPLLAVLISAGVALFLGILIVVSGGSRYPFLYYYLPKGILPLFLMALFWSLSYGLLGALFGVFLFSRCDFGKCDRWYVAFLFLCTLILSYTWFPVIYRAGALFLGLLLCFLMIFCFCLLWGFLGYRSIVMFLGMVLYSVWLMRD